MYVCMFLYSAVFSLNIGPLKVLYTFCPPGQTCSFRHQPGFSGKHSSHAAIICATTKSLTFPPLAIAGSHFIQLSELGRHGENENARTSKRYCKKGGFEHGLA